MVVGRLPPCLTSYFDIPLGSTSTSTTTTTAAHTPAEPSSQTHTQPRLHGPLRSPPPSVPYSPAFSEPRAGSSRDGTTGGSCTPAFSDDEVDVDEHEPGSIGAPGVKRVRSRSFRRKSRVAAGSKSGRGLGLGMTGIVPPSTKVWGVSKWKGGREVEVGLDEVEVDQNEQNGDQESRMFGTNILVEEGTLLLTTTAAWEEAFHPTLGLMRRDRGGEAVHGFLPDERLATIGDDVEWLVVDLRFVVGQEEYRQEAEVLGQGKTSTSTMTTTTTTRPALGGMTHRTNSLLATHTHARSTSSESITSASSSSASKSINPACLPKVHKLTFLGSEYAETMSPSRAAEVKSIVQVLQGLLAVEWLPSNDDPMGGNTSSSFSPAPFTPLFTTRGQQHAGTTVTFPTCLVPQDLIEAGKRWNTNWNRKPEGDDVFRQDARFNDVEDEHPFSGASFPTTGAEPSRRGSAESNTSPRQSGHRFYSDVSEKHRQDAGSLSQTAISPLQWLGGLRCLKVQGGFPVPQPDESLGLVKPDYSFAFKTWIGDNGVETLVWSFKGSYTETTTLTILKHLFKFITTRWIEVGKASYTTSSELRPACSLLVLQSVDPTVVAKLRNAHDTLTRRRVGLRLDDDVPADAFEWLRDVVFLEDKVVVEEEDREVPKLTRLWDTENEEENILLDMDQVRALVRLKAEVLAHARAGRGAKPRPVRSKRGRPTKPPLDSGAFRERRGDLRLDLSADRARPQGEQDVPDESGTEVASPPKTASTVRPAHRSFVLGTENGSTLVTPGMSRASSYTSAPSVTNSIASLGSSVSLGTIADDLVLSPRLAVGDDAAILAGDEEDHDDMCPTIRVHRADSIKSPLA